MEPFQGTVFRDGQVVLPRVSGTLEQHPSAGPDPSWSGVFIIPAGQHIGAGGPFVLALDDGRCGEITIRDVSSDDASDRARSPASRASARSAKKRFAPSKTWCPRWLV